MTQKNTTIRYLNQRYELDRLTLTTIVDETTNLDAFNHRNKLNRTEQYRPVMACVGLLHASMLYTVSMCVIYYVIVIP